jgi:hypothetical protein
METGASTTMSAPEAQVAEQAAIGQFFIYQYVVKFVCGKSPGEVVARGRYFTAINVHNPSGKPIRFRKKFAVALPEERPGPVSEFFFARLGPDQALEIDNGDIFKHLGTSASFIKGFAVLESLTELDVVAVYTTAGENDEIETFFLERAPFRRVVLGLPDLVPVSDPQPGVGFCRGDGAGNLLVTVKNQGTAAAPASQTKVEFFPGGVFMLPTPPIPAGAQINLMPLPFPPGCFSPDCSFVITVDATGVVVESNEANNTGVGSCIG